MGGLPEAIAQLTDPVWMAQATANAPDAVIAEELGVAETTVRRHRVQLSLPAFHGRGKPRPDLPVRDAEWMRAEAAVKGDAQIARELGVGTTTVRYWRVQHGIPPMIESVASHRTGPLERYPQLHDRAWLAEQAAAMPDVEIARKVGCVVGLVRYWRKALDVPAKYGEDRRVQYPQLKDATWLAEQLRSKTCEQVAQEIGCSKSVVTVARQRLGMDRLPGGPRKAAAAAAPKTPKEAKPRNPRFKAGRAAEVMQAAAAERVELTQPEWMQARVDSMSDQEMAGLLGCSSSTIHYWRNRHGIHRERAHRELRAPLLPMRQGPDTRPMAVVARPPTDVLTAEQLKLRDAAWMGEHCDRMTDTEIAQELGVIERAVAYWRKRHGIRRRSDQLMQEARRDQPARPKHLAEVEAMADCDQCGFLATPLFVYEGRQWGWIMEPDQKLRQARQWQIEHRACGAPMRLYLTTRPDRIAAAVGA